MYNVKGDNPTKMYFQALQEVTTYGDKTVPRGKPVLEMRPACLEFTNPYNRVTFLRGRRVNPFFQVAESLWILSGRADVEWLKTFNANIAQFSDDGKWFNAAYGERMRAWNKNALHSTIINPIDQLADVYTKIVADPDTRQAVIVLSNPMFDNSTYTIGERGRDIACNLCITFKVRDNKLHMTVFNRSNDIHWGVFGANLCQFTTIQEVLLGWLRKSGNSQLAELEMGTYSQITDSLHVYLDDYGSKITDQVMDQYKDESARESLDFQFEFKDEPRMELSAPEFDEFLAMFWNILDPYLMNDEFILDESQRNDIFNPAQDSIVGTWLRTGAIDSYWNFVVQSLLAYRLAKLGHAEISLEVLGVVPDCQWKVSMLYFLKPFIRKLMSTEDGDTRYQQAANRYIDVVRGLCTNLISSPEGSNLLIDYLRFDERENGHV